MVPAVCHEAFLFFDSHFIFGIAERGVQHAIARRGAFRSLQGEPKALWTMQSALILASPHGLLKSRTAPSCCWHHGETSLRSVFRDPAPTQDLANSAIPFVLAT